MIPRSIGLMTVALILLGASPLPAQVRVTPKASKGGEQQGAAWAEVPESFKTMAIPDWPMPTDLKRWNEVDRARTRAIRNETEQLIGGIGFDDIEIGKSHRAEVGYWLAKPYWGRGIITAVVGRVCQHAFEAWGLVKITAHVFSFNAASARVLEVRLPERGLSPEAPRQRRAVYRRLLVWTGA